jgi:putative tryptophan/tyrosine transport system substrate-binding protein
MPHRWSRRQVVQGVGLAGLGLLAGCGRLPWQAAPAPRVYRIGWLSRAAGLEHPELPAFREALRELGYVEGQNLVVEPRPSDGGDERLLLDAMALVQLPVDVIVAVSSQAVAAAKQATATIPIVFPLAADPVGLGFVESLAQPGGNVTGIANLVPQLSGKRLDLLKEVSPGLQSVAYLWDPTAPQGAVNWRETQGAAEALGLRLLSLEVSGEAPDLEAPFAAAVAQGAGGLALLA